MKRSRRRTLAVLLTAGLVLGACGDDGGGTETPGGNGTGQTGTGAPTTLPAGEPTKGGTLTFVTYSETAGLDPVISSGNGVAGYNEMAAIYDTIVRYNTESGEYENHFAESVEHNADYTVWTLKLKDGITFSDGTPYDAEAVKFGMDRHRSGTVAMGAAGETCDQLYSCPGNRTSSGAYMSLISSITVVDPLTVEFTLSSGWATFPFALSAEPAMIPSPTAYKAACPDPSAAVTDCIFNQRPVGAGPFVIDTYERGDQITVVPNPNWFGGEVYVDRIVFLNTINDAGGARSLDALVGGSAQAAFLRDAPTVAAAKDAGFSALVTFEQAGAAFLVNHGVNVNCNNGEPAPTCTGKPDGPTATTPATANPLVRQAIAAAIDIEIINTRGYEGEASVGTGFFQDDFPWYGGVEGPTFDLDRARELVEEAKAGGWDGVISVDYSNSAAGQAIGLATQAMLESVGMTVNLDTTLDTAALIQKVVIRRDFDLVGWGLSIPPDDGAMWALAQNLRSTSASNRVGYSNPVVDQALADLLLATTDEAKRAGFTTIAEEVAKDVPILPFARVEDFVAFQDNVHGLKKTGRAGILFDEVWISS